MDPLTIASLGVGGLSALLKAIGVIKSPEEKAMEKQDATRNAQRAYLEKNLPDFDYQKQAFDPSQYQDVLGPLQERLNNQQQGIGNNMSLAGAGRGGVSQELALSAMRKGNQDIANTTTGLARTADQDAYNRALELYKMKLAKTQALANVQG